MISIRIYNQNRVLQTAQLPSSWVDISVKKRRQLLQIAVSLPYPYNFHNIILKLLNVKESTLRQIPPEQLQALYEKMHWMVNDPVEDPIFSSFRHGMTRYYYPKGKLWNATGLEYALADEYYTHFVEEGDEKSLLHLAATLIRPQDRKKKGAEREDDPRIALKSRAQVELAAKKFHKMPAETIHAAFLLFIGCKNWVYNTYGQFIFEESGTSKKDPFGWYGTFFTLSEMGAFGTVNEVQHENFHTICQFLMKRKMDEPKQKPKTS